MPDFTVEAIIASLNEEGYIARTLDSVCSQTLFTQHPDKVSIVVADSTSTDRTVEIAKRYPVKVLDVPRGKLSARDAAIRASKADIIVALDADTLYYPDFFEKLVRHFASPGIVGVAAGRHMWNTFGQWTEDMGGALNQLGLWNRLGGGASAFRRKAFIDIGGWDLSINQKDFFWMVYEEEIRFGDRMRKHGKIIFEPDAICVTSSRRAMLDPKHLERIFDGTTF